MSKKNVCVLIADGTEEMEAVIVVDVLRAFDAVYFGAVGIKKYRLAVAVGLLADAIGFVIAVYVVRLLFG